MGHGHWYIITIAFNAWVIGCAAAAVASHARIQDVVQAGPSVTIQPPFQTHGAVDMTKAMTETPRILPRASASAEPSAHDTTSSSSSVVNPTATSQFPSPPLITNPVEPRWPPCAPNGTINITQCLLDGAHPHHRKSLELGLGVGLGVGIPTTGLLGWLVAAGAAALWRALFEGAAEGWLVGQFPWMAVLAALPLFAAGLVKDLTERGPEWGEAAEQVQHAPALEADPMQQIGFLEELRAIEPGPGELTVMGQVLDRMENGQPPMPPHEPLDMPNMEFEPPPDLPPGPGPGPGPGPLPQPFDTSTLFSSFIPSLDMLKGTLLATGIAAIAAETMIPDLLDAIINAGGAPAGAAAYAAGEAYVAALAGPGVAPHLIAEAAGAALNAAQHLHNAWDFIGRGVEGLLRAPGSVLGSQPSGPDPCAPGVQPSPYRGVFPCRFDVSKELLESVEHGIAPLGGPPALFRRHPRYPAPLVRRDGGGAPVPVIGAPPPCRPPPGPTVTRTAKVPGWTVIAPGFTLTVTSTGTAIKTTTTTDYRTTTATGRPIGTTKTTTDFRTITYTVTPPASKTTQTTTDFRTITNTYTPAPSKTTATTTDYRTITKTKTKTKGRKHGPTETLRPPPITVTTTKSIGPTPTPTPNPQAVCRHDGERGHYAVFLRNWGFDKCADEGHRCARGLLDNLRGQCRRAIKEWACEPRGGWEHSVQVSFWVDVLYPSKPPGKHHNKKFHKCVQDAIWLASPKDAREGGVTCQAFDMLANERDGHEVTIPYIRGFPKSFGLGYNETGDFSALGDDGVLANITDVFSDELQELGS